jgi:hypothetical protein
MRFLRCLGLALGLSMLSAAPSMAAVTYSWPVAISQPITMTNIAVPAGDGVFLYCYISPPSGGPLGGGIANVFATQAPGGGFSFSSKVSVSVVPIGQPARSPQSGDHAYCELRIQTLTESVAVLGTSTLILP